jgi:HK97 gp10 family phage protein
MVAAMNLDQFASLLERAAVKATPELEKVVAKLGPIVAEAAKEKIGHEQPGWPPLAASTIEEKAAAGFETPAPLLRTGAMRESITSELIAPLAVAVGSSDKTAVYQELGTSRMPPRPFIAPAMLESLPAATRFIVEAAEKLFRI